MAYPYAYGITKLTLATVMLQSSTAPVFSFSWLRPSRARHRIKQTAMQLAAALVATATPEKRWCQAVSKGLHHKSVAARFGANPWVARGLGDGSWASGWRDATSNQDS